MNHVIIVAGGKGLRMGGDIPKQFLVVGGEPILMRTIRRFHEYDPALNIIVVLPKAQQDYWKELCVKYVFGIAHTVADGGETRFHSVKNGLSCVPAEDDGLVGVHDGVRPFVTVEVIGKCYDEAGKTDAVIPVTPVIETLRCIDGRVVPRADYRLVQTPQVFRVSLLKKAYEQPYEDAFTDDASVVERMGMKVTLVDGNRENIKVTTPFDITIAEALVK